MMRSPVALFGFFCFSAVLVVYPGFGQTWTERLNIEERNYETGRIEGISERLLGGLEVSDTNGGYSKEERIRAHKLITTVALFSDNQQEADNHLVLLLKEDKEHKLNKATDPVEFFHLYNEFRIKPIFRVHVSTGPNLSFIRVINDYGVQSVGLSKKVYNLRGNPPGGITATGSRGLGLRVRASVDRELLRWIEVGAGFDFRISSYGVNSYVISNSSEVDNTPSSEVDNTPSSEADNTPSLSTYLENQQWYLSAPVFVRFLLVSKGSIRPFISFGASFDYLLRSTYAEGRRSGGSPFSLSSDFTNLRDLDIVNVYGYSSFASVGVKVPLRTNFLVLEGGYNVSMRNYIDPGNRYNNPLLNDLAFVEDDLFVDFAFLSAGFQYSIYGVRRLKKFR